MKTNTRTKTIVGIGLFTAIVVVLQALAVALRPTGLFSISLVLVPIVVGAALYGAGAGAWLGFVFGVVVLINDASAFLAINIPGTVITCLLKGAMCGLLAGLVYRALAPKSGRLAVIVAAIVAPVTNTGIFLIGCYLFFFDTIKEWAAGAGYESAGAFLILAMVGVNFLIEMAVNLVLSAAIVRIIKVGKHTLVEE